MQIAHTIECLLKLRSVRDQFADAELDISSGELAEQLAALEAGLVDQLAAQREHQDGVGLLTVAVVGDFNSGKSTFINALLGKDLCPVGEDPTTSSVTHFIHGDKERIEQQLPDGERKPTAKSEYRSLVRHDKKGDREPYIFYISVNSPILEHIRLVDTPGFNAPPPNTHDTKVTENAITEADALFVLIDTRKGNPTKSLLEQLDRLQQTKEDEFIPPMFLLLNKAEDLPPTQRTEVKRVCQAQYGDLFRDASLISALQMNNSDDAAPLDALETATQQVRDAIMRRDSFEAQISAKVVSRTYRMDINGNVYEAPASSGGLVSREQLCEMVRSVAAERHVLFERQLERKTTQLREDWQKTISSLDRELKRALRKRTGGKGGADKTKKKALEAIDEANSEIINLVDEVCTEVMEQMVTKDQRIEEGFFSDSIFYQININTDAARKMARDHSHWDRISFIEGNLLDRLYRMEVLYSSDDSSEEESEEESLGEILKEGFLQYLDDFQEGLSESVFEQDSDWQYSRKGNYNFWFIEYLDAEYVRDEYYNRLHSIYRETGIEYARDITRDVQTFLDSQKEPIVSNIEQSRSSVQGRAEELDRLQQRINELKEYTP